MSAVAAAWPWLKWPVGLSYLWWGAMWLLVARYYLGASARQWAALNPGSNCSGVVLWLRGVAKFSFAGLARLAQGQFGKPYTAAELGQPSAMILQHGIVCTAFCSGMWGLTLFSADRSDYSVARMLVNMLCVALSTVGALIHLYPALHARHLVLWRSMMLATWLGVPLLYAASAAAWALSGT